MTTTAGLNVADDGGRIDEDDAFDEDEAVRSDRDAMDRVGEWANPVRVRGSTGRGIEEEAREGEEDMIKDVSAR